MSQTSPGRPRLLASAGAIALAHAIYDSYAYVLPPLLPILLTQAGLTQATGAALMSVQLLASSLYGHWSATGRIGRAAVVGCRGQA